jgi:hypothetical protein
MAMVNVTVHLTACQHPQPWTIALRNRTAKLVATTPVWIQVCSCTSCCRHMAYLLCVEDAGTTSKSSRLAMPSSFEGIGPMSSNSVEPGSPGEPTYVRPTR